MNTVDMHIHSEYSADGELSVAKILTMAKMNGLNAVAITDHNSVKGLDAAIHYGKLANVTVIPGIEIDCEYRSVHLHLLGYFIDWKEKVFSDLEQNVHAQELSAFPEMIEKLRTAGIEADVDEVLSFSAGKNPCGELIGEVLLRKENAGVNPKLRPYLRGGERSEMPYLNFYRDYFAQGRVAHVPLQYMQLKQAIALVKNSKGIPVIAHPGDNLRNNMDMLDELVREGVMGIEVFSSYHTPAQVGFFYEKAKRKALYISCGSDFHGKNKPGISIGDCNCPCEISPMEWLTNRKQS